MLGVLNSLNPGFRGLVPLNLRQSPSPIFPSFDSSSVLSSMIGSDATELKYQHLELLYRPSGLSCFSVIITVLVYPTKLLSIIENVFLLNFPLLPYWRLTCRTWLPAYQPTRSRDSSMWNEDKTEELGK